MSATLIRVEAPEYVVAIARANHVSYSRTDYAASVTLLSGVTYFWSAS